MNRRSLILALHAQGRPAKAIAEDAGCSLGYAYGVLRAARLAAQREPKALDVVDPADIDTRHEMAEALAAQRHAERELRALAARTTNDAAKCGALKASAQIAATRLSTLERCGLLPPGGEWLAIPWEVAQSALTEAALDVGIDLPALEKRIVEGINPRLYYRRPRTLLIDVSPRREAP